MNSLFVTGTDTDVGKTCVTAGIVDYISKKNIDVGVMKPFASGYKSNDNSVSEDVEILTKFSKVNDSMDLINPYFFEIPTSPYEASLKLNREIDISKVVCAYEELQAKHDLIIVEGIGGIMTPIKQNYFVSDLILDLKLNSIIVTGSKIGSVNHLMLTFEHLRQKNLNLNGFIVNQNVSDGYELASLRQQISRLTGGKVFGAIPFIEPFNLDTYVQNFQSFVDLSHLGLENV